MLDDTRSPELAALLAWYRDMGVDHAVGETPIDWLSRGDRAPGHALQSATAAAPCRVRAAAPLGLRRVPRRRPAPSWRRLRPARASFRPRLPMRP